MQHTSPSRLIRLAGAILPIVWAATPAQATTWLVQPDGTGDAPTIQAAFDSAQSGDDVLLAPGLYSRTSQGAASGTPIATLKAGVPLHSQAGAAATILDGEWDGRVLEGHDIGSVLIEGITIRKGLAATGDGGGLLVTGASTPTIRACSFVDFNIAVTGSGGAIRCDVATIEDCDFVQNQADFAGGALRCTSAQLLRCTFRENTAGSGDSYGQGGAVSSESATIEGCVFEQNGAGGFNWAGGALHDIGQAEVRRSTFLDNGGDLQAFSLGGAVLFGPGLLEECLFVGGHATMGGAVHAAGATVRGCTFLGVSDARDMAVFFFDPGTVESCTLVGCDRGIFMPAGGTVHRTIVAQSTNGPACGGDGTWSCSDLFGNAQGDALCGTDGGGNFSADPAFCAADPVASRDVSISGSSPCAEGNHPDGDSCDLIGAGPVDCGTTAVRQAPWSEVKSRYRD